MGGNQKSAETVVGISEYRTTFGRLAWVLMGGEQVDIDWIQLNQDKDQGRAREEAVIYHKFY
jgi:hypothetical protein